MDNSATTRCSERAKNKMVQILTEDYGNPSSLHNMGKTAEDYIKEAKEQIAKTLRCDEKEIIFTSGGTESNNMALIGGALANKRQGKHIITTAIEHASVQAPLAYLKELGYEITELSVDHDGIISLEELRDAVREDTVLVSIMMVNNEIGTRNDVERLAAEVKRRNSRTIVHVDAVQAWMRVPIKLDNIDTMTVSGHKIHAPKGIGALYLSDRLVQAFQPPYLGGEQERGLRPGTENLPYAMGLAAAATRLAGSIRSRDKAMRALNDRLRAGLSIFPEVEINSPAGAVPEVLNFSEMCIKSETMLAFLAEEQIYVSSASACGRGQLAAMGRDPLAIDTAIRVSFCADNTPEDVDAFLERFEDGMKHLQKKLSDFWNNLTINTT